MEQAIKDYLDHYEDQLMQHLLKMLTTMKQLDGKLLETDDLNDIWQQVAPSYVADAVKEIAKYPTVALGWAMYLGMGVAQYWDKEWEVYGKLPNIYEYIRDKRGFDYLDEVVRGDILGLHDETFQSMESIVQTCSQQAHERIRHEQIEPQSPLAFHVFARSIRVLYKLGAAIQLHRLGYKFQKLNM